MGSPWTSDPLMVVSREISNCVHYSDDVKSQAKHFAQNLKTRISDDPVQRALASEVLSLHTEIRAMDELRHGPGGVDGNHATHWATYIKLTNHMAKLARLLGLRENTSSSHNANGKGLHITPPRPPAPSELEADAQGQSP